VQGLFMNNLTHNAMFYKEYHALIVRIGKEHCKKTRPLCSDCPINIQCLGRVLDAET
jgi:endonuclease-3 related protein